MIDCAYVQRMARYNKWQNANLYGVADALPDDERRRERGAFFGSIHKTLSHLLWGDRMWMSRFTDVPKPEVRQSAIDVALSGLGAAQAGTRRLRCNDDRLGRRSRPLMACRRSHVVLRAPRKRNCGSRSGCS